VFDGHGGDAASQWLNSNLYQYWAKRKGEGVATEREIVTMFEQADKALLKMLESGADAEGHALTGAGSTASLLWVTQESVVAANVGDSSAVLSRRGAQVMLTTPHRVYGSYAVGASWVGGKVLRL